MSDFGSLAHEALVDSLLMEVSGLLLRLIETGETGAIDLSGLPLSPACIDDLDARLGAGEISASLDIAGRSSIRETRFPGVWWVRHEDEAGRVIARLIEVTSVPKLFLAHRDDMVAGLRRLPEVTHVATFSRSRLSL